jgi:hypothetical protein
LFPFVTKQKILVAKQQDRIFDLHQAKKL